MQAEFVHIQDAGGAAFVDERFGLVKMTKIPVVRADEGEDFLMQGALGVEFADEVGSIASLAFLKQADEAVTSRWDAPR